MERLGKTLRLTTNKLYDLFIIRRKHFSQLCAYFSIRGIVFLESLSCIILLLYMLALKKSECVICSIVRMKCLHEIDFVVVVSGEFFDFSIQTLLQ